MLCANCKGMIDDDALFCPYCAFRVVERAPGMAPNHALVDESAARPRTGWRLTLGIGMIGCGIGSTLVGLFIYLWIKEHSPYMGFGEMLTKFDSYYIKEPFYSLIVVVCAGLGLVGFTLLSLGAVVAVLGLVKRAKA